LTQIYTQIVNIKTINLRNANNVIRRLKNMTDCKRDFQLAKLLNVSPTTLSTWKSRDSLDFKTVIDFCVERNFDLNEVLLGEKPESSKNDFKAYAKEIIKEMGSEYMEQLVVARSLYNEMAQMLEKIRVADEINRAKKRIQKKKSAEI